MNTIWKLWTSPSARLRWPNNDWRPETVFGIHTLELFHVEQCSRPTATHIICPLGRLGLKIPALPFFTKAFAHLTTNGLPNSGKSMPWFLDAMYVVRKSLFEKCKSWSSSENTATPVKTLQLHPPCVFRDLAQLMLQINFCTLKHLRTCPILGLQGAKVHKGPYETSKTHKLHSCMLSFYAHRFKCSVLRLLQIYLLLQKASIQVWDIHKKATYKKKKLCTDA